MDFPSNILLFRVRPEKNERRFYRLRVLQNLFGDPQLLREFGRIDQPGRVMIDTFAHFEDAEIAFCELSRQKLAKGYRRVFEGSPHAGGNPACFRTGTRIYDVIDDPISSILLAEAAGLAHDHIMALEQPAAGVR